MSAIWNGTDWIGRIDDEEVEDQYIGIINLTIKTRVKSREEEKVRRSKSVGNDVCPRACADQFDFLPTRSKRM